MSDTKAPPFFSQAGWSTFPLVITKVLILIEVVWAIFAIVLLAIFRADTTFAGLYLNDMILSVLAHVPTAMTLVFMLHKYEKGAHLSFLRVWWLISSIVLEAILTATAFIDFPVESLERNSLITYSLVATIISFVAFVLYMGIYIMQWMTGRKAVSAPVSLADVEQAPGSSQMSFTNGVANLRFPLPANARIVHQPRKDL